MRTSHACPGCGADLARTPTTRESHYGLSVAVCPRCGRVTARRRLALERRRKRKLGQSIRTLISQALLAAIILLSVGGLTRTIADTLEEMSRMPGGAGALSLSPGERGFIPTRLVSDIHPIGLIAWVVSLTCAGIWLAAAQRHIRPWISWSVTLGAAMTIMWFVDGVGIIASAFNNAIDSRLYGSPSDGVRLQTLLIGVVLMGVGAAFGCLFVKLSGSSRPARLQDRRRKLRRRRACA